MRTLSARIFVVTCIDVLVTEVLSMMRSIPLVLAATLLAAGLALAEPRVEVAYHDGVPQISLPGVFAASRYTVLRAAGESGPFTAITQRDVLCLGTCFADDLTAVPGCTYWYRFDVAPPQGATVSYGPFAVTIAAPYAGLFHTRVFPNPSRGATRIEVYMLGASSDAPLETSASIVDAQGRRVRAWNAGYLRRGITTLSWDGRDDRGTTVPAGQYYLRLVSPLGSAVQRILRVR